MIREELKSVEDLRKIDPHLVHPISVSSFCDNAAPIRETSTGKESPHSFSYFSWLSSVSNYFSQMINPKSPQCKDDSQDKVGLSQDRPIYCHTDPGYSVVRSASREGFPSLLNDNPRVGEERLEGSVQKVFSKYGHFSPKKLHGAQLFHGSNSSSLLAFTSYGAGIRKLAPLGELERRGTIPFSGEIIYGRTHVNRDNLSTTWLGKFAVALDWTKVAQPWNIEMSYRAVEYGIKQLNLAMDRISENSMDDEAKRLLLDGIAKRDIDQLKQLVESMEARFGPVGRSIFRELVFPNLNRLEVERKRQEEFKKLNPIEKKIVLEGFPILYGIRTDRSQDLETILGTKLGEILLKGGASFEEIRVIFVPQEKIEFVKTFLKRANAPSIAVEQLPEDAKRE